MTEEQKKKLQEGRKKACSRHSITEKEFDYHKEHFIQLWYDQKNNLAIFLRKIAGCKYSKCYEVVEGVGKDLLYPTSEQFGSYGWAYPYNDIGRKSIMNNFGIELPEVKPFKI